MVWRGQDINAKPWLTRDDCLPPSLPPSRHHNSAAVNHTSLKNVNNGTVLTFGSW